MTAVPTWIVTLYNKRETFNVDFPYMDSNIPSEFEISYRFEVVHNYTKLSVVTVVSYGQSKHNASTNDIIQTLLLLVQSPRTTM